jgi:hypothetical protein
MNYARRTDRNQAEIIGALRAVGAAVESCHHFGHGFPDLIVVYPATNRGGLFFLEVKDGEKIPSKQRLTEAEEEFILNQYGHVQIVRTVDEALRAIGAIKN